MMVRNAMTAICIWSLAFGCSSMQIIHDQMHPKARKIRDWDSERRLLLFASHECRSKRHKGLKVELEVTSTSAAEGFFVDIHALVDDPGQPDALRSIRIGSTSVFKPPRIGERIVVYMSLPKEEAWRSDGKLWLTYQVAAGNPERVAPEVKMKISQCWRPKPRKVICPFGFLSRSNAT